MARVLRKRTRQITYNSKKAKLRRVVKDEEVEEQQETTNSAENEKQITNNRRNGKLKRVIKEEVEDEQDATTSPENEKQSTTNCRRVSTRFIKDEVEDEDEATSSTENEYKTLLDLNDDMLSAVISRLGFTDRLSIRVVSKRLHWAEQRTRYPKEREELANLEIFPHSPPGRPWVPLFKLVLHYPSGRKVKWTTGRKNRASAMMDRVASTFATKKLNCFMDLDNPLHRHYLSFLPKIGSIGGEGSKLSILHMGGSSHALLDCNEFLDMIECFKVNKLAVFNVRFPSNQHLEMYTRLTTSSTYEMVCIYARLAQLKIFAEQVVGVRKDFTFKVAKTTTRQDGEVRRSSESPYALFMSHAGWITQVAHFRESNNVKMKNCIYLKKHNHDLSMLVHIPYKAPRGRAGG